MLTNQNQTLDSSEQRLHPATLLFGALSGLRGVGALLTLLLIWSVNRADDFRIGMTILIVFLMVVLPMAVAFIYHAIRYAVIRVRYEGDEIIINSGILFRSERHIPYRRVQNIDLVQNVLHRLLKVAVVKVETSSGEGVEAELRVMSLDAIETMRDRVFADRPDKAAALSEQLKTSQSDDDSETSGLNVDQSDVEAMPTAIDSEVLKLRPKDLAQIGLITNRGFAVISVLAGIGWQLETHLNLGERYDFATRMDEFADQLPFAPIVQGVFFALTFIVVLYTFSICWSIARFHDFRLIRRGDDLRITCGLFTRVSATIPRRRLQFISVRESALHRLFKKAAIRVETAGTNIEDEETTLLSKRWFVPLVARERLDDVLNRVEPQFRYSDADWQPLSTKARRRMIRRAVIQCSIIGVAFLVYLPWLWGMLILISLIILGAIHAWRLHGVTHWAVTDRGIAFRTGVILHRTSITLFSRVHVVQIRRSPFDRRWGMSQLKVDTAGAGTAGHRINIRDLSADVADSLRRLIMDRAEHSGWQWS